MKTISNKTAKKLADLSNKVGADLPTSFVGMGYNYSIEELFEIMGQFSFKISKQNNSFVATVHYIDHKRGGRVSAHTRINERLDEAMANLLIYLINEGVLSI